MARLLFCFVLVFVCCIFVARSEVEQADRDPLLIQVDVDAVGTATQKSFPPADPLHTFIHWLQDGGASFSKLDILTKPDGYRGAFANKDIKKKEHVMRIPLPQLMSLEKGRATPIGRRMFRKPLQLIGPKHSTLAQLVLTERNKTNSFYQPYFDILPKNYSSFPIFFSEEELKWLQGSPMLKAREDRLADLRHDYETIAKVAPALKEFSFEEWKWARVSVSSRLFAANIHGVETDILAPLADMLNHKTLPATIWYFSDEHDAFIVEAVEDIPAHAEIFDGYGRKCNHRFLLNYGFINPNNPDNEFKIAIELNVADPIYETKRKYAQTTVREFSVSKSISQKEFQDLLSYCRFVVATEEEIKFLINAIGSSGKKNRLSTNQVQEIPPFHMDNEIRAWQLLSQWLDDRLAQYNNTIEVDEQLLQTNLTWNQRNCVQLRMGEKQVLTFFSNMSNVVQNLFELPIHELREVVSAQYSGSGPYDVYIQGVVLDLASPQGFEDDFADDDLL
eukprot:GILJ01009301.1.p1 GENE.GILJ01009301.1~~GILJ01009301.1.p1  ORF type:complete len:505 (-),score=78.95 GILJ01009301.1:212-1726(-)